MHATLRIAGAELMLSDGMRSGPTDFGCVALSLTVSNEADVDRDLQSACQGREGRDAARTDLLRQAFRRCRRQVRRQLDHPRRAGSEKARHGLGQEDNHDERAPGRRLGRLCGMWARCTRVSSRALWLRRAWNPAHGWRHSGNGMVVRNGSSPSMTQQLDASFGRARRIALTHHNGSAQVLVGPGGATSVVWTADFLPDEATSTMEAMMEQGMAVMKQTLDKV